MKIILLLKKQNKKYGKELNEVGFKAYGGEFKPENFNSMKELANHYLVGDSAVYQYSLRLLPSLWRTPR